ncbi:MAG: DUF262 domain-containing protein [Chloroflexota bacterium]
MNHKSQIIYKQLLKHHGNIQVPMIQRDFAQGRPTESTVREMFLMALDDALRKPIDDPTLPLNLDFIYGSVEQIQNETRFLPLDGQQRLTTLFLLHWYLAWRDERWVDFEAMFVDGKHSKFTYNIRPSSNEFFDQLVCYRPALLPEHIPSVNRPITTLFADQPWYFRNWRLDPTIQSVLYMLDAIHERFVSSCGLFERLIDETHPAITFQLLDLKDFGLSDDLYIKMNARGKPLTPFETFKARYEEILKSQFNGKSLPLGESNVSVADYVAHRIDAAWTDLFWKLRDRKSHQYDEAFMNLARAVAFVTRNPDNENYLDDVIKLRNSREAPSYRDFHERDWLDERFTLTLIHLLDSWSRERGTLFCFLPNSRYFDERVFFDKIALSGIARLSYTEVIQFAAYVKFVDKYYDSIDNAAFHEWMRICYNLSTNTIYNRPEEIQRSIRGLSGMLENADDILRHFAQAEKVVAGFSEPQIAEEKLKAMLILAESRWQKLIDLAEHHGYFCGQIGFLLDFCGALTASKNSNPNLWDSAKHTTLQDEFERYLTLAKKTFSATGLIDQGEYRWQRALLSIGDYLLPRGRNHSFLVDTMTDETSWKRLLRGIGNVNPEPREFLKQLWDQLNPNEALAPQLDRIINADLELESWQETLIHYPEAFKYCEKNYIRKYDSDTLYLLSTSQLHGYHAELFTYCLYIKLKKLNVFTTIRQIGYNYEMDYSPPCLTLSGDVQGMNVTIFVFNNDEGYLVLIAKTDCSEIVSFQNTLKSTGYSLKDNYFQNWLSRSDIETHLKILDEALN